MMRARRVAGVERASLWEWGQAMLLAANLIWTTLCLGGYRPETKVVTLTLTGLLLFIHFVGCAVERRAVRATDWAGWCMLPFLAYSLINVALVTPVRWLGWIDWLGWTNMAAVFWVSLNGVRSNAARQTLFVVLVLLGLVAVVLACYQRFVEPGWLMLGRKQAAQFLERASGPFGIPNSLAAFLLLLLPATGALAFRRHAQAAERIWWVWVTCILAFGLVLTVSRGGWMALALALIAWPLGKRIWSWKRRALAGFLVFTLLIVAGAVLFQAAPKTRDRFDRMVRDSGELSRPILWSAAWQIFREHPLLGSGAGSFTIAFEQHRPAGFVDEPQWAHNEYLNTASDCGAVGLVLLMTGAAAVVISRRRAERSTVGIPHDWLESTPVRGGLAVGVISFALQLFVDFHFKIPALAMAFALVVSLALGRPASGRKLPALADSGRARLGWPLAAGAVALTLVPAVRLSRAEDLRYRAREAIDEFALQRTEKASSALVGAEKDLQRATSLAPGHGQAWSDLAFVLQNRALANPALVTELAEPATRAARRATAVSREVPEFWIRLGVALDMNARRDEAEKAFENALRLAPRNSHAWYYYAYHLSFDTDRRDAALRAIANCLSLDPGNGAAEALRLKLNERTTGALTIP